MSGAGAEGRGPRAEAIVGEARRWIGTPYRHQASVKGGGCDCLGLVRGVWRAVVGAEPEGVPAYRADWAEVGGRETLLEAAERWLERVPLEAARPGDVLLFRMSEGAVVKHCAVLSTGRAVRPAVPHPDALRASVPPQEGRENSATMIHAYWGRAVVESWLGAWWRRRLVAAFRLPGAD